MSRNEIAGCQPVVRRSNDGFPHRSCGLRPRICGFSKTLPCHWSSRNSAADGVGFTGGDNKITWRIRFQDQLHGAGVVSGVAPVHPGIEAADVQGIDAPGLQCHQAVCDALRYEFRAPQGRFVVVQDAAGDEMLVIAAVIIGQHHAHRLGGAVDAAWPHRRVLGLRADCGLAEDPR